SDSVLSPEDSTLSFDGPTTFLDNTSGGNGGALALLGGLSIAVNTGESSFVDNSAGFAGGAVYVSETAAGPTFSDVSFDSNSAQVGGAVSAIGSGNVKGGGADQLLPTTFSRCRFTDNRATATGGAVDSASGQDLFEDTVFRGNQAVTGGALRLAGTASLENCSFVDNVSDEGEGAAVSNVGVISEISNTNFSGNVFNCAPDTFLNYTSGDPLDEACSGCQATCDGCAQPPMVPLCSDVIPHSMSDGGVVTLETLSIDPGYWRAISSSTEVLACYNSDACVGGITGATGYCGMGYEGPYCAICGDSYSAQLGFTCSTCPDRASGIVLATALAVIGLFTVVAVISYLAWRVGPNRGCGMAGHLKRYLPLQTLKIPVVAWQIVTQFTSAANVTYPGVYRRFLNGLDVFNFDLSWILSAGCVMDLDFHDRLLLSTICPIIALLFLAATYSAGWRINRGNAEALQLVWDRHVSMVLLLLFLVYSSVSSVVFQTYACDQLDGGGEYLRADYRIECDSSKHQGFRVYAGFMILLYPVGIPALYGALLFRARDVLEKDPDSREDPPRVVSISSLWKPYRPAVYYYEVIECGRRILLTGLVVFIYPNTAAQIAITLIMTVVFAVLSEAIRPYAQAWDTWVSRVSHAVVFMSVYVALLLKVDVSNEKGSSQKVFEAVLVTAHACMILAVVVETILLGCPSRVKEQDEPVPRVGGDSVAMSFSYRDKMNHAGNLCSEEDDDDHVNEAGLTPVG
ncbi:unnamed protein product, partial [Ectocarpus sp. 4 AP-2014]